MTSLSENGPLETQAWVIPSQGKPFELRSIVLPVMKNSQVQIEMSDCGLCHTELHMQDNDWGISNYPLVAGHEGIGIVSVVGQSVLHLKVGDRVGVTWIRDSCGHCSPCSQGRENLCCTGYQGTYLGSNAGCWGKDPHNEFGGCFSKIMRVEAKFVIKIPDLIPTTAACPLLCGGTTVFEPICDYVKAGTSVGVVGIGGLGTIAIKLGKLVGGRVTALSTSSHKEAAARSCGATDFVNTQDPDAMTKAAGTLDVIIDTTPANADVAPLLNLLKFDGMYVRVGIPTATSQQFSYNWIPLIFTQRKIAGSVVSGSLRSNLMMQLAADNWKVMEDKDDWAVQSVPFSQLNDVVDKLRNRTNAGYRYVLHW